MRWKAVGLGLSILIIFVVGVWWGRREHKPSRENEAVAQPPLPARITYDCKRTNKELDLPTLRTLLRVIRYAEEGRTPVAVTLEDLRDKFQRQIVLEVYLGREERSPTTR
jgi:hypothetical protein